MKILFVEGINDKRMIKTCYEVLGKDLTFFIISFNGMGNIKKVYDLYKNYDILFLTDNDKAGNYWKLCNIPPEIVITTSLYEGTYKHINELEEFLANKAHYKKINEKKKMIMNIISLDNIKLNQANKLVSIITWYMSI